MEEIMQQLMAKTGIDEATATKVVDFLRENWDDVAKWIGGEKLGDMKENVTEAMGDVKDKISGLFNKD
ncbi:MAG: hypothetical protein JXE06_10650 [Coriobacteriia bacterium]|nr:hypothetical protein [Coriobacteriia bacterium]MBN2821740.1 hypothetical protein [Coriobacteriia bacterium]